MATKIDKFFHQTEEVMKQGGSTTPALLRKRRRYNGNME